MRKRRGLLVLNDGLRSAGALQGLGVLYAYNDSSQTYAQSQVKS